MLFRSTPGEFNQREVSSRSSSRSGSRSSGLDSRSSSSRAASNDSVGRSTSTTNSEAASNASNSNRDSYVLSDALNTRELESVNSVISRSNGTLVYQNPDTGIYELLAIPANDGSTVVNEETATSVEKIISTITGRDISAIRGSTSSASASIGSSSSRGSSSNSGSRSSRDRVSTRASDRDSNRDSSYGSSKRLNPGLNYPDSEFYDFLQAQIVSRTTKVLAAPTLLLQEGGEPANGSDDERISADGKVGREASNESYVRVGTQYVTKYKIKQDENGNAFCEAELGNAGLSFGARVDRIDDNGFVTFSLSPEISAPIGTQPAGTCGDITLISERVLDTGRLRVRDGQTLILTGVLSEDDVNVISKWPVLGDLPIVGQFFRFSERRQIGRAHV